VLTRVVAVEDEDEAMLPELKALFPRALPMPSIRGTRTARHHTRMGSGKRTMEMHRRPPCSK